MGQKLGQHFLKDNAKIKKIIEALEIKNGDVVIEIGAGHGELTKNLKSQISPKQSLRDATGQANLKIIAIEKDGKLAEQLRQKFADCQNIEIIEGDALKKIKNQISKIKIISLRDISRRETNQNSKIIENLKIVGNIPYYITGYLFRVLGELENKPSLIILTIQKEVALRICAKPPHTSLLATSIQYWANPEIVDFISKKSFSPQPKVDSAIIKLTTLPDTDNLTSANYYKLIKVLFKQPRKTIKNNILPLLKNKKELSAKAESVLIESGLKLNDRPQNISVEIIKKLSQMLYNEAE